jgi:hypothetical protein
LLSNSRFLTDYYSFLPHFPTATRNIGSSVSQVPKAGLCAITAGGSRISLSVIKSKEISINYLRGG